MRVPILRRRDRSDGEISPAAIVVRPGRAVA
jgi:hypothetical protein